MSVIRKLEPHVADLIAAGEVVERPASVVKELVENSLDAGATQITVEIQRGGMELIRVTDNGCGMSPEDAGTAFLRHATSKLRDAYGLEAIGTLGFRGEALAAISAVSRVQLITRLRGSDEGLSLLLEAGVEQSREPAGCPEGTTILVRDLFYNTPARLKFMKKDSAEGASVTAALLRCALSHPEVSIRYLKDGKEEFQTPGSGAADACIYAVLGRDFAKTMLRAQGGNPEAQVEGYICPPANAKGNRSSQYFFLNGRTVKSALLQSALEQAYHNALFTGRYPMCVLYLNIRLNQVDVNVHPAKTEVRFLQERMVFDAVYRTVLSALQGETERPQLQLPEQERQPQAPAPALQKPPAVQKPATAGAIPSASPGREPEPPRHVPPRPRETRPAALPEIVEQLVFSQSRPVYNDQEKPHAPPVTHTISYEPPPREEPALRMEPQLKAEPPRPEAGPTAEPTAQPLRRADKPEQQPRPQPETRPAARPDIRPPLPPYRILGEAFKAYIVVESGEELVLIDKHAAHERILFDRLKAQEWPAMGQLLMTPQICELEPEDKARLLEQLPLLEELGIDVSDFGGNALAVRQLPAGFDPEDAAPLLGELSAALQLGRRPGTLGMRDETLATMACKAAIKAGSESQPPEWKPIVEAVLRGEVKYCPHGRPVTMRLTHYQIDRNFKRA